jgi:hypothetical protein
MKAIIAALMMLVSQKAGEPAAPNWHYSDYFDSIENKHEDRFVLEGKWVNEPPSFPSNTSKPSILVACSEGTWRATGITFNAILDTGEWPIDYRIDDVRGQFTRSVLVKGFRDNTVFITKADFGKIMRAETVFVRLRIFREGPIDAQFDLSVDFSKIKEKCPK